MVEIILPDPDLDPIVRQLIAAVFLLRLLLLGVKTKVVQSFVLRPNGDRLIGRCILRVNNEGWCARLRCLVQAKALDLNRGALVGEGDSVVSVRLP